MKSRRMLLQVLLSTALVLSLIVPALAAGASRTVPLPDDHPVSRAAADSSAVALPMALNTLEAKVPPMVVAGCTHIVGLRSDGTVVTLARTYGGGNVGGWKDMVQVAAGGCHEYEYTVGVKSDGTVVAVGFNDDGQCDVDGWTDIVQVAAGDEHTVGLKSDGTVVAVGRNDVGQCNVARWRDIVQVDASGDHTVGLKSDGTVVDTAHNAINWTGIIEVAAGGRGEYAYTVGLNADGTVVAVGGNQNGQCDVGDWTDITQVAAGGHTVGLKSDGSVIAVGWNAYGQCDVDGWTDITQVDAGDIHTVGLKSDGSVVARGFQYYGECDVGGWMDIVQVAAGGWTNPHTVGLRSDGTVVAAGSTNNGQCDVGGWMDIVQVAAGGQHTVGVKSDGTVVAVGGNGSGQCDVGDWTDIIQVAAADHTVGLKEDGTVVAVGSNYSGQCEVGGWTDIVQVSAGDHTVGLKSDGTVVAVGWNDDGQCDVINWTDIIQVAAGERHTVGLKSDGTVVAVGHNKYGQCDVGGWADIVQVAAGGAARWWGHTVGLKSDGTVVTTGFSSDGWTDIVQVAAGVVERTVGLKSDSTVVATGPGAALARRDLGVLQYDLTVSCTIGGSTTTPGEGIYPCRPRSVINLVAEPEQGYRFVRWTGDVSTVGNVNTASTTITMHDDYSVTAAFAMPPIQYNLIIASTAGGSVAAPGEGTFGYDEGTAVNLVAEPERGYDFVGWNGEVDTIADIEASSTTIGADADYSIKANFVAGFVGARTGDWIKFEYTITGWPPGQPHPEWLELEFLTVEGTSAMVGVVLVLSEGEYGTELGGTVPVDLATGSGEALGLAGFVIPSNLRRGDSVYISGYGDVTIEGETTRTYAGVSRRVLYASFSESVPYQGEVQLTYYWDKLTGVMVETSTTSRSMSMTCSATETNMFEAAPAAVGMPWWLWVIIAVAVAVVAFAVYRLRKRKTPSAPALPPEGS